MSSERKVISFEDHVKKKQNESLINRGAKVGKALNFVTIPAGIITGAHLFVLADIVSDIVYSEVQKRNNLRIEEQERGRFRFLSRKSRLTQVAEVKTIAQKPPLKRAA